MSSSSKNMANAIRALAMDAVQAAKSGHPGMPMGMAEIAVALWARHLKHNPQNPLWADRDRFVLSNGHGSMLIYALLHLTASHTLHLEPTDQSHDRHLTVSLGVKNLTNTSQPTPLLGGEDPFGEAFEASRVYGPIEGRRFLLRLSHDF